METRQLVVQYEPRYWINFITARDVMRKRVTSRRLVSVRLSVRHTRGLYIETAKDVIKLFLSLVAASL